ncbi:hypothetical protein ColLi_10891 [Colletotrichum liriopes]|uniref:Extracellular serine-threonine rich protein n=1 Tax=Colletotrichum liriopes TaxID=708192 RepID=A0AA37GVH7_9PEZI|nr:hypothetical protein ColLi_10891 [Colletotrichum liriopes]
MKWLTYVSTSTFASFMLTRVLADVAEEECWRGPAMRLGGMEYFETPDDAAACPEAHIYFLGLHNEVLLSRHVNITNSSTTCDSNLLQAVSFPADVAATYAKITFLCGNDDGPSCQMIRLLPAGGSEPAAPLSLAMARTCLDSSTATATSPSPDATDATGVPPDSNPSTAVTSLSTAVNGDASAYPTHLTGIQSPPAYSSTDVETGGSVITPTSLGSNLGSAEPTSTAADFPVDPSETNVVPTTLIESTGGATTDVPSVAPSDAPSVITPEVSPVIPSDMPSVITPEVSSIIASGVQSDATYELPGATTLVTSTVAGISHAPRCTCESY